MRCLCKGDEFHTIRVSWTLMLGFDTISREVELKFTLFMWMLSNREWDVYFVGLVKSKIWDKVFMKLLLMSELLL